MAKEKKKVDPQQRKQRKLLEQDKARKKIPLNIFKTPEFRDKDILFRGKEYKKDSPAGESPAERKERSLKRRQEYLRKRYKEQEKDLVKESKVNGTYKKRPIKKGKSEQERGMDRVEQIKKQQAADDAAFKKKVAESKKNRGKPIGSGIYGRGPLGKNFIGKKMNMGGVMKGRGGTFKGVY
jgi:hypothetical protein